MSLILNEGLDKIDLIALIQTSNFLGTDILFIYLHTEYESLKCGNYTSWQNVTE